MYVVSSPFLHRPRQRQRGPVREPGKGGRLLPSTWPEKGANLAQPWLPLVPIWRAKHLSKVKCGMTIGGFHAKGAYQQDHSQAAVLLAPFVCLA